MRVIWNPDFEPEWDAMGIRTTDFRPHFEGNLVNLFSVVTPLKSKAETQLLFRRHTCAAAGWILDNRKSFGDEDRFQIILGWSRQTRPTGRQVVKVGGTFSDLSRLIADPDRIVLTPEWEVGVCDT